MQWDNLAEMHLLLREHGLEPELDDYGYKMWFWFHPSREHSVLTTYSRDDDDRAVWQTDDVSDSVDELRELLLREFAEPARPTG